MIPHPRLSAPDLSPAPVRLAAILTAAVFAVASTSSCQEQGRPAGDPAKTQEEVQAMDEMPAEAKRIKERAVLRLGEYRLAGWPIITEKTEDGSQRSSMQISLWREGEEEDEAERITLTEGQRFEVGRQPWTVHRIDDDAGVTVIAPADVE